MKATRLIQFIFYLFMVVVLGACSSQTTKQANTEQTSTTMYQSPCLQMSLQGKRAWLTTGYGTALSLGEAKQVALYDIASQLKVNVSGESTRKTNKNGTQATSQFSQTLKAKADAILRHVEPICTDTNDPKHFYHVTLQYDRRPLADIFTDKLMEQFWGDLPGHINWVGPTLITQSEFIQSIEAKLVDPSKTDSKSIRIQLFHQDNKWQLAIGNVIREIENSDFKKIINWNTLNNGELKVSLEDVFGNSLSNNLVVGDEFRFRIAGHDKGFLSIFNIYEDGRVVKLRENIPFNEKHLLPDHGGSYSAGLLIPGEPTLDRYVFMVTKTPIDTMAFQQLILEQDGSSTRKNYTLNLFLGWLDGFESNATLLVINTIQ